MERHTTREQARHRSVSLVKNRGYSDHRGADCYCRIPKLVTLASTTALNAEATMPTSPEP